MCFRMNSILVVQTTCSSRIESVMYSGHFTKYVFLSAPLRLDSKNPRCSRKRGQRSTTSNCIWTHLRRHGNDWWWNQQDCSLRMNHGTTVTFFFGEDHDYCIFHSRIPTQTKMNAGINMFKCPHPLNQNHGSVITVLCCWHVALVPFLHGNWQSTNLIQVIRSSRYHRMSTSKTQKNVKQTRHKKPRDLIQKKHNKTNIVKHENQGKLLLPLVVRFCIFSFWKHCHPMDFAKAKPDQSTKPSNSKPDNKQQRSSGMKRRGAWLQWNQIGISWDHGQGPLKLFFAQFLF